MRQAKHDLLRQAHTQRERPVVEYLQRQGLKVVHASPYAPLLVVELPKGAIPALAQRDDVLALYRVFEMRNELDTVANTVHAPVVWMSGITGNGIKVGIVEKYDIDDGVVDFRNPYLADGIVRPGFDYSDYAEHATEVAGVVASTHAQFRGIASGVTLLSTPTETTCNDNHNDDGDAIIASDWAMDQGAHVLNCSFKTGDDEDALVAAINTTPLVDVMLVLLIIFMVTAPMMSQGLDVALPQVTAKPLEAREEPTLR